MADLESCRVHTSATLRDALRSLERSRTRIALATDDRGRLVGVLTDGDVRRALLRGATLESPLHPYLMKKFTSVGPDADRTEILDLMQARQIEQIPILSGAGKLLGLHTMHEILGAVARPNWAVVMAGGKGTRLRPITEEIPKPMIRVAGRPILERIVLHLVGFGIRTIYLAINHLGHIIRNHFGDGSKFGCTIRYLEEKKPLGTGGPLSLLPKAVKAPLVVMNGDLVTQADFGRMLDAHRRGGYELSVGVREYAHTIPYGCVDRKKDRIVRLVEKPRLMQEVNAGIYVLDPSLLRRVPRGKEYPITSLIEDCIERGKPVGAFFVDGDWIDVGHHDQLRQAKEGADGP